MELDGLQAHIIHKQQRCHPDSTVCPTHHPPAASSNSVHKTEWLKKAQLQRSAHRLRTCSTSCVEYRHNSCSNYKRTKLLVAEALYYYSDLYKST